MTKFKYFIVLMMWLLVKPLAIVLATALSKVWIDLLAMGELWIRIMLFAPMSAFVIYTGTNYIKSLYHADKKYRKGCNLDDILCGIFAIGIIPLGAGGLLLVCAFYMCFPNKYYFEDLKKKSAWSVFLDLSYLR